MPSRLTVFHQQSAASLEKKINAYFKKVKKDRKSPTLTGLALHLRCTRSSIADYSQTDEYSEVLSMAKLQCEHHLEERITDGAPSSGLAFILKNNYGWKEKTEVENTHKGLVSLGSLFDQAAATPIKAIEEAIPVEAEIVEDDKLDEELF